MRLVCVQGHDRCYLGPDPDCPYCERKGGEVNYNDGYLDALRDERDRHQEQANWAMAEIERLTSVVASYALTERELKAEIERLSKEKDIAIAHSVAVVKDFQAMETERNLIIEECAKVAETCRVWDYPCATIAAAIRALKEKP